MIICVGATKGGSGKTTLATNITVALALAGKNVLLVDGDEQATAITFTEARTESLGAPGYTAIELHGSNLRTQVRQFARQYTDLILDVGGRDSGSLRAALTVADVLLIPVQPRTFDLWAFDNIVALIKEAREVNDKLRAFAVINAADAQGKDNDDAAAMLMAVPEVELLPVRIGRRKAFSNGSATGRGVVDYLPRDTKAIQELEALITACMGVDIHN